MMTLTRNHFDHMTRRCQLQDGTWVTECACGWTSAPAAHPEMLGWVCHAADAPDHPTAESIAAAKAAMYTERRMVELACGIIILDNDTILGRPKKGA